MSRHKKYFTTGELAALYNIPKQTLLYYDKNELLIPEFINEKGYRFYSATQYHDLEIILNMRKLDISVQDIKTYLSFRNIDCFKHLLSKKEKECDATIKTMLEMKKSLQLSLAETEKISEIKIDQMELAMQPAKLFLGSEVLTDNISPKARLKIFARHNQEAFDKNHFKEFSTGWIIDKNEFFTGKPNKTVRYFTPVSAVTNNADDLYLTCPAGMYLTVCFQGTFYQEILRVVPKIQDFMTRNYLKAIDDIYILPLKNHWVTENTMEYINKISFQVESLK